jgi:hypothetical protein
MRDWIWGGLEWGIECEDFNNNESKVMVKVTKEKQKQKQKK